MLVANEVNFFKWICLGGQDGSLGAIAPVPLPGYVTELLFKTQRIDSFLQYRIHTIMVNYKQ